MRARALCSTVLLLTIGAACGGKDGATGPQGPAGPTGSAGPGGAQGPAGPAGADGATGATGTPGAMGATGADGAPGTPGADGATGATGPQGPAGPAGPTGATGDTGPMGPAGPTGPQGEPGNANVQSSVVLNRVLIEDVVNTVNVAAITQAIVDTGAVLVYIRTAGGTNWIPLPVMQIATGEILQVSSIEVGAVKIYAGFDFGVADIRVVTIAGTSASALMTRYPGVDFSDPDATQRALRVRF